MLTKDKHLYGRTNSGRKTKIKVVFILNTHPRSYVLSNGLTYTWWGYQLTKTVQNGSPWAIFEILHIEYQIVCCIETYLIHIYHMNKCSNCNWNKYIDRFCMWNVHFHINGLSPNIALVILMSWPLIAIFFFYWIIDYFLCSFHILFNGNK